MDEYIGHICNGFIELCRTLHAASTAGSN